MLHSEVYHNDFRVSLALPLLFSPATGDLPTTLGLTKRKRETSSCGYGVVALSMTKDIIRLLCDYSPFGDNCRLSGRQQIEEGTSTWAMYVLSENLRKQKVCYFPSSSTRASWTAEEKVKEGTCMVLVTSASQSIASDPQAKSRLLWLVRHD